MECMRIEMEIKEKLDAQRQKDQLRNYSATLIQQAFRRSRCSHTQAAVEPEELQFVDQDDSFEGQDTAATLALSTSEEQKAEEIIEEIKDPSLSYDSFSVTPPLCSSDVKISIFQSIDIPGKVISPVNSDQLFDLTTLRNDFEQIHRRAPSFNPPREHGISDQTANKENESMQQKIEVKSIESVLRFQRRLMKIDTNGSSELKKLKDQAQQLISLVQQKARQLEGYLHQQRDLKKKMAFSEQMLNFLLVRSTKSPKKRR